MRRLFERDGNLLVYLIVSSFLLSFGHRVWQAMFDNYAVEKIGVGPEAIGWIQSARELSGLMAFLLAFLARWHCRSCGSWRSASPSWDSDSS